MISVKLPDEKFSELISYTPKTETHFRDEVWTFRRSWWNDVLDYWWPSFRRSWLSRRGFCSELCSWLCTDLKPPAASFPKENSTNSKWYFDIHLVLLPLFFKDTSTYIIEKWNFDTDLFFFLSFSVAVSFARLSCEHLLTYHLSFDTPLFFFRKNNSHPDYFWNAHNAELKKIKHIIAETWW